MSSFQTLHDRETGAEAADASVPLESRVRAALDKLKTEKHYHLEGILRDPTFFVLQLQRNLNGTSSYMTDDVLEQYVLAEAVQFRPHFSPDEDDDD